MSSKLRLLALLLLLVTATPAEAHRLGIRPRATAVDSGPRFPYGFAAVSDTHWRWIFGGGLDGIRNDVMLSAIIDTLNTMATAGKVDFLLFGGDWAHDVLTVNNAANRDSFEAQMGRLRIPVFSTVGNHEIDEADTVAMRPPHFTATQKTLNFRTRFGMYSWYRATWKTIEIYALNVNPNLPNRTSLNDYRDNNPTSYASPYGGTANDFYGISVPSSQQRQDFTSWLAQHDPAKWEIGLWHRSVAGVDDVSSRKNYAGALRGTGFIREWELARPDWYTFLCFTGDEHVFRVAKVGRDSTIATAGQGGSVHVILPTGSGMRQADMTDLFGANTSWIQAHISRDPTDANRNLGKTSLGVMDTLTVAGDPELPWQVYWTYAVVVGDDIELSTYRTPSSRSAGATWYRGAGHHVLVDRRTIHRDNRQY